MRVNTKEAARIYGCNTRSLLRAMLEEGVTPEIRARTKRSGGISYWWEPQEVLKARAERHKRYAAGLLRFAVQRKRPADRQLMTLKARATLLERNRRRILQRIADRTGQDVKKLLVAAGLETA